MTPHSATLLRALATLHVAEIRFNITRDGDTRRHTTPRARIDDGRLTAQPFSVLSVDDLFESFAITPHKGTYTLRVADGKLAHEPLPVRKPTKQSKKDARRHEKLAA